MTQPKLYGLANCDTCKKARNWLTRRNLVHEFIDYREQRPSPESLKRWAAAVGGWGALVNRSGTTWRKLPVARKEPQSDPEWTLLLREHPTLVRRPLVEHAECVSVGFSDKLFRDLFQ